MKTNVSKFALGALVSLFLGSQWGLCADNTPPAQAAPGTPPSTDTKTQMNNPSGPATQTTAAVPPDTKKVENVPSGPDPTGKSKSGVGPKSSKKHHHKHSTSSSSTNDTQTK